MAGNYAFKIVDGGRGKPAQIRLEHVELSQHFWWFYNPCPHLPIPLAEFCSITNEAGNCTSYTVLEILAVLLEYLKVYIVRADLCYIACTETRVTNGTCHVRIH